MTVAVAFALMGAFFMGGLYVAGALGALSLILMMFYSDAPLWNIMGNRAWETTTNFIFIAIPLFILMGEIVLRSGIAERMYSVLARWLSFIPGGLLHSNIASCAIFAACAGSSVATAATISKVALPAFRARGYNERLVVGSLAAGGTLGILIPPSVIMILYGLMTGTSVGRLFLAGFIPGIILALSFMLMIGIISKIWPGLAPREENASWRLRITGLLALLPVFALIFAVLGSIYFGIATPTEAAAAGVTGALFLALISNSGFLVLAAMVRALTISGLIVFFPSSLRHKLQDIDQARPLLSAQIRDAVRVNMVMLKDATLSAARTSGMILFIFMAAFTLQFTFAILRISVEMAEWVSVFDLTSVQLVLVLVVFYLILGTFMESYSMMLTTLPILFPVLLDTGVDLLWFGIIMVILLEAAQISPPQGMALYVLHGARRDVATELSAAEGTPSTAGTINDVYIGVLPFMAVMLMVIGLVIAFPALATWLPDQMKGLRR